MDSGTPGSIIVIQARDDGGLHQAGNSVSDEKWSDSGCTLKAEQQGLLMDWLWGVCNTERGFKEDFGLKKQKKRVAVNR